MENLENNVVTEEVQVQDTETQEQVKTFTQEEVNEMIAKRIAREAKKIEAEKEKAMQLKLKAELEESEKLAKMSEAERVKAQAEKERKLFEEERKKHLEERRQFEEEKILRLTMEALEDKKLPGSFAKFLKVDTADDIMENISVFEKGFNDAVEKAVWLEHGNRHSAHIHSKNVDRITKYAKAIDTAILVKNAPSYAALGFGGEGYCTFTIASRTGEGLTSASTFTKRRRCVMSDSLCIR